MTPPAVKILVADDSSSDRAAARGILADAGYTVCEAGDGQQVLEVFNKERPGLVVLDVVMPRIGGLEVCRILKAKAPGYLPVLMVSTRNSVNARVEGLRSGADDYLGKPYNPEELRARVEVLLRTRAVFDERLASYDASSGTADPGELPRTEVTSEDMRRRMQEEFERAERYSDPLACLRIEVDEVAGGRPPADLGGLLRNIIESNVRKIDLVVRVDERGYLLVLPNTHFPGALTVAERISRETRKQPAPRGEGPAGFTVSIGVSFFPNKDTKTLQDMLELVDAALERARREQGGKICLFQHQGYLYAPDD
ncbi:MAG: response regulator [Myxococcales bacterium]|nr:response regulator [Myxococcales bacterium]